MSTRTTAALALAPPLEQPWWVLRSVSTETRRRQPRTARLLSRARPVLARCRALAADCLELAALTGVFVLALGSLMALGRLAS